VLAILLKERQEEMPDAASNMSEELSSHETRILIAEDDPDSQKLMNEYMQLLGYEYDFAANGKEAIEKLKGKRYSMCFIDIHMPVMDGLTATKIIRSEISQNIPLIALSAAVMKEDQIKGKQAGMNEYLTKPVSLEGLQECIMKYCQS